MNRYVLDTSALLTYIENEAGSTELEGLFAAALEETAELYVSVISFVELLYISQREQGAEAAQQRLELMYDLPIIQSPIDILLAPVAADIKARKPMSLADSCIAALAMTQEATLVHKDPEYEQIADEVMQLRLPYKRKS